MGPSLLFIFIIENEIILQKLLKTKVLKMADFNGFKKWKMRYEISTNMITKRFLTNKTVKV